MFKSHAENITATSFSQGKEPTLMAANLVKERREKKKNTDIPSGFPAASVKKNLSLLKIAKLLL